MKVAELLKILKDLPGDMEISITDGYQARTYQGDFEVTLFEDCDDKVYCDIGIGGMGV